MLVEVRSMVPEELVPEYYVMVGRWLQGASSTGALAPSRREWGPDDAPLARQMREGLPPNAGRLLDLLLDEGELGTERVAEAVGLGDPSQVTGVAGWVGRIANTVGRLSPIKTSQTSQGTVWRLDPEVAALFRTADSNERG